MAAAIAAFPHEAIASGARTGSSPSSSAARRWSRIGSRWRALCEPATLPVSSLTQVSWASSADSGSLRPNGVVVNPSATAWVSAVQSLSDMPLARANAHHASRRP